MDIEADGASPPYIAEGASSAFSQGVERRTCILVLGMHRSGTSALTRVLSMLGAALPLNLLTANETNQAGHWEPAQLIGLHDQLLAEAGHAWDDWRAVDIKILPEVRLQHYRDEIRRILREDYGDAPLIVLKEPRISRFAPFFMEVLSSAGFDVRVVLTVRNPLEVSKSLELRDGMSRAAALLLWLRYQLDSERATRGCQRSVVSYDGLLSHWRKTITAISEDSGIAWPVDLAGIQHAVEGFLTADLRHHNLPDDALRLDPMLRDWIAETYDAIRELERNPGSTTASRALDRVQAALDQSALFIQELGRPSVLQREAVGRLSTVIEEQAIELQALHESNQQIAWELENIRADLRRRDAEMAALLGSTSWRLTGPLRMARRGVAPIRRRLSRWGAERRSRRLLQSSPLFDPDWYVAQNPDIRAMGVDPLLHYLRFGGKEGRAASPAFNSARYLEDNPEVARSGTNPLVHYLRHGIGSPPEVEDASIRGSITQFARNLDATISASGRPRILVLPAIFGVGGVERNTAAIMHRLADQFQFVVVTNETHTKESGCLFDEIVSVSAAIFDLASIAPQSRHAHLLQEICAEFPPDLVWVCNGSVWYHQNLESVLAAVGPVPIIDQEVYDSHAGWINQLTDSYLSRVSRVVAVNAKIETELATRFDCGDKIDLIYPAIDVRRLPAPTEVHQKLPDAGESTRRYFFIGRLAEQKRPLDLIEVGSRVHAAGCPVEIVLVGSGPLAEACTQKIRELGASNVSVRPFVDDVASLYREADAVIFVSEYEGLPIVMLEALASGVPILATDVGDIRLVAGQLGGGCVVVDDAIGRPDRMAEALLDFHRDLQRHKTDAVRVSDAVRQRFGADNVAYQYFRSWALAFQQFADRDLASCQP